jgi:glutathione S-transferase
MSEQDVAPVLYHYPVSFSSQVVRLAFCEKGLIWKDRIIDIGPALENLEPWYMALNEKGVVPTLVDGGEVISGCAAICRYIDNRFCGPSLLPSDESERLVVEDWVARQQSFPEIAFTYGAFQGIMRLVGRRDLKSRKKAAERLIKEHPELASAYRSKIAVYDDFQRIIDDKNAFLKLAGQAERLLELLGGHMTTRGEWIAADYSLADVVWTAFLARLDMLGYKNLWENGRNDMVCAYYKRLKSRPSFKLAPVYRKIGIGSFISASLKRRFSKQP